MHRPLHECGDPTSPASLRHEHHSDLGGMKRVTSEEEKLKLIESGYSLAMKAFVDEFVKLAVAAPAANAE